MGFIMDLNIGSETQKSKQFELVIQVRDNKGNCTGKTKSFFTDDSKQLEELWIKNNGVVKKRRRKKAEAATTKNEVNNAIKQVNGYVEKIRKKKEMEE
jgi:hypothetical protein